MPDLPTPNDAAEAALFSECWDAVLSYADLCTAGSAAATQLATEAFALGIREARVVESASARGTGRRAARLPVIPLLLTAVRTTAAAWESGGKGHDLDPDLRLWLHSEKAARYTGPPLQRPLALRGLRDLQEADAALLWLAEVETLPLTVVARRLGLDPAAVGDELGQVRGLFRDRCHRAQLDSPMAAHCRSYARLLDGVTRSPAADIPPDLSRHLSRCVDCAEAAACLRPHGGGLPAALVGGVIGWGGLAYLERRRRAAEVRLGVGRPELAAGEGPDPKPGAQRARMVRTSLLAAAVSVSLLALAVSMMPFGGTETSASEGTAPAGGEPAPFPSPSFSIPPATSSPRPPTDTHGENSDPEPQGTSSSTAEDPDADGDAPASCTFAFDLVNQWPDGFQATLSVTTAGAVDGWRVAWTFADGQRVGQMWDASVSQDGSRVTAVAADYNRSVPADGTLTFGFLATWKGKNTPPTQVMLNGRECAKSG
ncbi:cellulose binding domain-containing protein [Streptomyces sp. NPDC091279]|uniref:cellulose binding domain-containing protein n=1 Tax=unclassified Streptomyces TaxID=2593676 RepID=UPI0037FC757D